MGIQLQTIIDEMQSWLDYQERERTQEALNTTNDTLIVQPPVWPTRGTIKNWIKVLQAPTPALREAVEKLDVAIHALQSGTVDTVAPFRDTPISLLICNVLDKYRQLKAALAENKHE